MKCRYRMITSKNLVRHELIGLSLRILESSNSTLRGLKGKVIGESRNMLKIATGKGTVAVPKDICTFEFAVDNKKVRMKGSLLVARPEDRIRKRRRE